jgi:hypothetical protein
MSRSPLNIPDSVYNRVFEQDGDGASILQELAVLFYDRPSFDEASPHRTSYNEGQRSVVEYLMARAAQQQP